MTRLLADPTRFAAAGLLHGALPFDAGVPVTRGRLVGVPVFLTHAAPECGPAAERACWPTLPDDRLPVRHSDSPEVSVTTPQQQESQNAPVELQEALFSRIAKLDGVVTAPSAVLGPRREGLHPATL